MSLSFASLLTAGYWSGVVALATELSAIIGGPVFLWGGRAVQKMANQRSLATEGKTDSMAQKRFASRYSSGSTIEKFGSMLCRVTPIRFFRKEKSEVDQIFERGDLLGFKRLLSDLGLVGDKYLNELFFFCAAKHGYLHVLQYLVSQGIDVNAKTIDHPIWTALHYASCYGHKSCVEYLLAQGADVNLRTSIGITALEFAIYGKHHQVVELLKKAKALDLTKMQNGKTILHRNVKWERETAQAVIALENNGINLPNERYGATALHLAVDNGNRELAEALIKGGALVGKKDHLGRTPMHIAALRGDFAMIKLLWKYWGRFDVRDREGKTPLDRAKERDQGAKERAQDQKIYRSTCFDTMTELQAENFVTPWKDFSCKQRDEKGQLIRDKENNPVEFKLVVDSQTSDVYEKVETFWQLRSKALLTLFATPFYFPVCIGQQLVSVVLDLGKISIQMFKTITQQMKEKKFLSCLSAFTFNSMKNAAHAIALRIWSIVVTPFYMIGMLFAAVYIQIDQLNGRKVMNAMAEGCYALGFLRFMGLAKVGNACESERAGLAQYIIFHD